MKASLKWLKEYVPFSLSADDLAEKLTMAGLEVKSVATAGLKWNDIVVAAIISVESHPNADRLKLVTVSTGQKTQTVVSGAPNLEVGAKVTFASVGAELVDGHTGERVKLKPAKIRGVLSEGMICSEKELGLSDSHDGIMILPKEALTGTPLVDYLGDSVLDLDVTPNRPDCMSVIGIAREISALTGHDLRLPPVQYDESAVPVESEASVEIVEPSLCPRYCATIVTGLKVGPSPSWLQERLASCDMRPINNVVDVTNYVMMEYGQPLHAFDRDRLGGRRIVVRRADNGETITSIDNVRRELTPEMLIIADAERPVAIAGIMGGLDTEVTASTTTVLLESANFERGILRRAGVSLGMRSEASARFEKGLSSELPLPALRRATQLILEIAGGKSAKGVLDVYPGKGEPQPLLLKASQVTRLLGVEIGIGEISRTLELLGFECKPLGSEQLLVTRPYWRMDISDPADLVEEVARVVGYDRIPTTMLSASIPERQPVPGSAMGEKVRDVMVGFGFQEVLTYSLVGLESLKRLTPDLELKGEEPVRLANPMSRDQEYLRTTLRANLVSTLAHNQRHETGNTKLFEVGKVFKKRKDDLPEERQQLCALFNSGRLEPSWGQHGSFLDFYDAKGVVEGLLARLCHGASVNYYPGKDEGLYPGKRADVLVGGTKVGVLGELHPKVSEAFELIGATFIMELDLENLIPLAEGLKRYQPFIRFPSVIRDLALVLDNDVTYGQVRDLIARFSLVTQVTLFDLYSGRQIPEGKKSFALRLVYQSPKQTLTEEEVAEVQDKILQALQRDLGAVLRT